MDDRSGSDRADRSVPEVPAAEVATTIARLLEDHKGESTVVLEVAGLTPIADWFVITTARSSAHLSGLAREVDRYLASIDLKPRGRHKRVAASGWLLLDCGDVIVHLMEQAEREFYDLERLWFRAARVPAQRAAR